jgi:hypothetical protein
VAFPLPEDPEGNVTQLKLLDAVQLQPAAAVTLTLSVEPPATAVKDVGITAYEHDVAADWLTSTVFPATVIVPDLAAPVLAANFTWAAPVPFALVVAVGVTIVAQLRELEAVQVHAASVVTPTLWVPPAATELSEAGASV